MAKESTGLIVAFKEIVTTIIDAEMTIVVDFIWIDTLNERS